MAAISPMCSIIVANAIGIMVTTALKLNFGKESGAIAKTLADAIASKLTSPINTATT